MAGRGSRFQAVASGNREYQKPKPLLNIKGKPMVWWAVNSLPFVDLLNRPVHTNFVVHPKDLVFIAYKNMKTIISHKGAKTDFF